MNCTTSPGMEGRLLRTAAGRSCATPVGNRKSILSINTNITGQKRLEAQFLRAQRMESIGTLCGWDRARFKQYSRTDSDGCAAAGA